ncbi:MAG: hypothetical protein IPM53_03765 [Anaerolineaceae bacterium]|nr:hypothetical protein [Anaerolineaceae bacterium]
MSESQKGAIVRGERITNQSAKGNRSYAQVRGLIQYIAYGRHADHLGQTPQQRAVWLDHNGQVIPHEAVRQWAKEKVHRYGYEYAYQLLLSTRHGGLDAADFNRALRQGSDISQVGEWKYMVHQDSHNQHAHAILFRQEKLPHARYKEWQQTMQTELERLQAERQQERQLELDQGNAPTDERRQALEQAAAELLSTDQKTRHQGWEMGL